MLDGAGTKSQVKERYEVSFASGEVRTCAVCHGVNTADQAGNPGVPQTKPQALRTFLQFWKSNNPPGSVQHAAPTASVLKTAGVATLAVTRTGGGTGPVSVNFSTADGSAIAGTDYATANGTLNWTDGDTAAKTITVPLLNPTTIGASKALTVTLSSPLYGSLGAPSNRALTIAEPSWESWLYSHFAAAANNPTIAADNADPDNDGLVNLVEYFLGTVPAGHPDAAPQAALEIVGSVPSLTLTFTRDPSRTDLTYQVQRSADVAVWSAIPDALVGTSGTLEVRKASVPLADGTRQFLRLKITRQ
jgi:hypothetical protein